MEIQGFSFAIEPVIETLKDKQIRRIALQLPEGLKNNAIQLVQYIKKNVDVEVFILADPCFGACDIPTIAVESLNIDLLIHIGHTPLAKQPSSTIPIEFIPAYATINVIPVMTKAAKKLDGKTVGLVTTAQHIHMMEKMKDVLRNHNATPIVGSPDSRSIYPGQILGCNFSAAHSINDKVDVFLYVGSGMFHPLGISLATKKPIYVADPYLQKVQKDELDTLRETVLRQRYGAIAQAKQSHRFGILISSKAGQQRINTAIHLQRLFIQGKKDAYLMVLDRITPDILMAFRTIECFISTACPRVAIDDYQQYKSPMLTPIEAEIALGIRKWTDYIFDEIVDDDIIAKK